MMMSHHHSRRMLPPGNNKKRKIHEADKPAPPKAVEPPPPTSNRLLAGYLAHEFLTKGTLFGKKYEPNSARTEFYVSIQPKKSQPKLQAAESGGVSREQESYGEVASIMKTDGTHIKGIVNPTQLSRWIQM